MVACSPKVARLRSLELLALLLCPRDQRLSLGEELDADCVCLSGLVAGDERIEPAVLDDQGL